MPLRSRHCNICGFCVRKYDHHCHWLGTCIGEKNQRLFLIYLFVQTLIAYWNLSIVFFQNDYKKAYSGYNESLKNENNESKGCWIVSMALYLLELAFVISMFGLHIYYAATNWTSWEIMRKHKVWYLKNHKGLKSPFVSYNNNNSLCEIYQNLKEVFILPNYPKDWAILGLPKENINQKNQQNYREDELNFCF